ncbi:unnamed protein product [Pleuronectes platessa]|uniref:Uncharacterized protein n=1 Tax=Pleuronectes platessa TaxID=8262 RepID=A0A9N7V0V3_PLEPL|nr:unnamed protein product [Pleuronectes platessa]
MPLGSQEEGEMEELQVNSDQEVEVAARLDGLEGGEHGKMSAQTEVTDCNGSMPPSGCVLVESLAPNKAIFDGDFVSERCSLPLEGSAPNSGHSVPEEETHREGI